MPEPAFVVHKFGGSSLADAECFHRIAAIVESDRAPRVALVLSACRGVTDELLATIAAAEAGKLPACEAAQAGLEKRHAELATALLPASARDEYLAGLRADLADLARIVQAVLLVRSAGREQRDLAEDSASCCDSPPTWAPGYRT